MVCLFSLLTVSFAEQKEVFNFFFFLEVFNFSKVTFNFFPPWIDHAFNVELSKVREFGMDMYTLLCLNWITNKDLLYSTCGSLLNNRWQPGWEGSLGENGYVYMYG